MGKVVYGSIIGLALVVALESHPPTASVMAVWLLGTALAVGLAEVYSEVVGAETSTRQPVSRPQLRHMVEDAAAVGFGVAFPAVFFLLSAMGLVRDRHRLLDRQVDGPRADRLLRLLGRPVRRRGPGRALVKGALVALVGAGLIALKAFVH